MERVRFINHKGKQVLVIDLSNQMGREVIDTLAEAAALIRAQPLDSVRTLTDATTVEFTLRDEDGGYDRILADRIRSFTSGNGAFVIAGTIVVGTDENKRVIAEFVNKMSQRAFVIFETREEALDWLVEQ